LIALDHDGPTAFAFQQSAEDRRVDAAHDSLGPHADTHLIADHEGDAAKHSLLFEAGM
jgi:hypothetical protein